MAFTIISQNLTASYGLPKIRHATEDAFFIAKKKSRVKFCILCGI